MRRFLGHVYEASRFAVRGELLQRARSVFSATLEGRSFRLFSALRGNFLWLRSGTSGQTLLAWRILQKRKKETWFGTHALASKSVPSTVPAIKITPESSSVLKEILASLMHTPIPKFPLGFIGTLFEFFYTHGQ